MSLCFFDSALDGRGQRRTELRLPRPSSNPPPCPSAGTPCVIQGFARQRPPVRRSGRLQPGKRRRRPILFRERETWVGRGHKSSPASTGGRCSTGSSVAGVGRLVAAEIRRRGRASSGGCAIICWAANRHVGLIYWAEAQWQVLFGLFDAHDVVPRISTTLFIYFIN